MAEDGGLPVKNSSLLINCRPFFAARASISCGNKITDSMIFGKAQTFPRLSVSTLHVINDFDYIMFRIEMWPRGPDDFEIVIDYCLHPLFGLLPQNGRPVPDVK